MKRLLIVLSLILPSLSIIAAPPPPPGSNNAPIDTGIWLVLIVGSLIGSYRIHSIIHKAFKAK